MLTTIVGIAYAETPENYTEGYYTYTLDADGNATITEYSGNEEDIVVPSTLGGHNVIKIESIEQTNVFSGNKTAVTITLSEGIQTIGDGMFEKCEKLVTVNLPSTLKNIGLAMFGESKKLESININEENKYFFSVEGVFYSYNNIGYTLQCYPVGKDEIFYSILSNTTCITAGGFLK